MNPIDNQKIRDRFSGLSTAVVADAMVRLGMEPRVAEPGIESLLPGTRVAGRALPVKHYGSVDVFFAAMTLAQPGDILVIDNDGRKDEGCIGDLTALEARAHGIPAMIVWGCHRDTRELQEMGFPVFSYGTCPFGPLSADREDPEVDSMARFCDVEIALGDIVFADDDGVIFAPGDEIENLLNAAEAIGATERKQAKAIASGMTLHKQFRFDEYLARRESDATYTFRKHLRGLGGAIEE